MGNLKRALSTVAIAGVLGLGSIAANAGIIITDFNKQTKDNPCSTNDEKSVIGIIITDLMGIIITDRTGIIITDLKTEVPPVNCGIIITD